jgi:hypothetical protein
MVDEQRDRAVHQAVVDGVQHQRDVGGADGTGGECAAEARERECHQRPATAVMTSSTVVTPPTPRRIDSAKTRLLRSAPVAAMIGDPDGAG